MRLVWRPDFTEFQVDGHTTTIREQMASSMATTTEQVKGGEGGGGTRLLASGESAGGRQLAAFAERSYTEFKLAVFYFSESGENVLTASNLIKVQLLPTVCRWPCHVFTSD